MRLACIVEGHGEVQAVPLLLRRLAVTLDPILDLQIEQVAARLLEHDFASRIQLFAGAGLRYRHGIKLCAGLRQPRLARGHFGFFFAVLLVAHGYLLGCHQRTSMCDKARAPRHTVNSQATAAPALSARC